MGELNLLPFALKQKQMGSRKKKKYFLVGLVIAAAFILAFCIPGYFYFSSVSKDNIAQQQLSEKLILSNKNKKLQQDINSDNDYLKSIDMMTTEKYSTKDNITLFQTFMTNDISLNSFSYSRNGVQINGTAKNSNSPLEFAANMQLSGKFTSVKLLGVNITDKGVNFTISVIY